MQRIRALAVVALLTSPNVAQLFAGPICPGPTRSLREEMKSADAIAIAKAARRGINSSKAIENTASGRTDDGF